jgi:hypothetical protein
MNIQVYHQVSCFKMLWSILYNEQSDVDRNPTASVVLIRQWIFYPPIFIFTKKEGEREENEMNRQTIGYVYDYG